MTLFDTVSEQIQHREHWLFYPTPSFNKVLQDLSPDDTDFVWFIVTIHLIELFGTKDPSSVHFSIARKRLQLLKIENDKAVDILARALVLECQQFKGFFFKTLSIPGLETLSDETGWSLPYKTAYPQFTCATEEGNALDLILCNFLETTGGNPGKEIAQALRQSAPSRSQQHRTKNRPYPRKQAWSVFVPQNSHTLFCPFLSLLSDVVWSTKCKQRWEKEKKHVPAITQSVLVRTITPPLLKGTTIETEGNKITCYSEKGKVISKVPCVDPKLVKLIVKGMQSFSSLSGHRLLRWQVRTGFYNWVYEAEDPRLICTSGGYEGIANLIGSGMSNKATTEVKAMLHAQAYGQFELPHGGSGNLIILREIAKHKNGEPSKINIILGEFLLPNFTHLLPRGEKRRLVPITDLPPLIGSKNTHAAQAMLQLLILEEFSKQSDRLAFSGSILIPKEKLKDLANQAKLPQTSLEKVITGWTEDDCLSKAFLKTFGDEYTLGQEYSNVTYFLEFQGKQRIEGAKGGVKGAEARKLHRTRNTKEKKTPS